MLLGYDKNGDVQFMFTDEKYLSRRFPNDTAKISNFWKIKNHGLTEFFIPIAIVKDWDNIKAYKIVKNRLVKRKKEEVVNLNKQKPKILSQGLFAKNISKEPYIASAIVDSDEIVREEQR